MNMERATRIRCAKCKHYQITWDAEKPYGCSILGFKSQMEPSSYVVQVSGEECRSFSAKTSRNKQ